MEPEAPESPLRPEAELMPLVVDTVEIVLAALEPTSPAPPIFANGSNELRISAKAFWWYPEPRVLDLLAAGGFIVTHARPSGT